jgi:hypothetical protein
MIHAPEEDESYREEKDSADDTTEAEACGLVMIASRTLSEN